MARPLGFLVAGLVLGVFILPAFSPTALASHLEYVLLGTDKDQNSITGDPITLVIVLSWRIAKAVVSIYIPGGDAYIAGAAAIWGAYNLNKEKYELFGSDLETRIKNHSSLLFCSYTYKRTGYYDSGLIVHRHSDGWLHVYRHYDEWGYFEKKGPLCFDEKEIYVGIHIWPEAYIAPGEY